MGRLHTFVVTLRRECRDINWGLRLVGGADLATPLIVTRVTPGTPAGRDLARGDIIAKVDDYDARDLRHEDAQNLFKNASNQIKLVVQRGGSSAHQYSVPRTSGSFIRRMPTPTFYHEFAEDVEREGPRVSNAALAPRSTIPNSFVAPYRPVSPLPTSGRRGPESLPRSTPVPHYTQFPNQQETEYRTLLLSPTSTRTDETVDESIQSQGETGAAVRDRTLHDTRPRYLSAITMAVNPNFFPNGYQDSMHPEEEVVTNWPYRTTPLVLPGAKVRREPGPTESYLRHHPNPAMRAPPHHDYRDTLMKQKVAESMLQRAVGEEGPKMVHKQFNSPINLYSDQNIANSIRQQTSPLPANGYYGRPHVVKSHKPTVQYDPAKSETFRALQEDSLGGALQEVPTPVHTKLFQAPPNKRPTPVPKPTKQPDAIPKGKQTTFVNSLHEEHIQQSNSFKRLMYNVLGDTEF